MATETFSIAFDKTVSALSLDPGNHAAVGGKKGPNSMGCIYILDLKDKQTHKTLLYRKNSEISHLAWNLNLPALLASASNLCCEVWDVPSNFNKPVISFEAHQYNVADIAWSKFDPHCLATCSSDHLVKQWDLRDLRKPAKGFSLFTKLAVSRIKWNRHDPNILASAHSDGKVNVWDVRKTSAPIHSVTAHVSSKITGIDWSYTNKEEFLTCACDLSIKVWSYKDLSKPQFPIKSAVAISKACYTPQGHILGFPLSTLSATNTTDLRLWKQGSFHSNPLHFPGHKDVVSSYGWRKCKDGSALITLGKDKQLIGWGNFSTEPSSPGVSLREDLLASSYEQEAPYPLSQPRNLEPRVSSLHPWKEDTTEFEKISLVSPSNRPTSLQSSSPYHPSSTSLPQNRSLQRRASHPIDSLIFMNEMNGLIDDIQIHGRVELDQETLFGESESDSPENVPFPRTFSACFSFSGHLVVFNNSFRGLSFDSVNTRTYQDFLQVKEVMSKESNSYNRFGANYSQNKRSGASSRKDKPGISKIEGSISLFYPPLIETSRMLATLYTLEGTPYEICKKNEEAARLVCRHDLVRTWRLLQNVTNQNVYKPSRSTDLDQFNTPWTGHPFGQKLVQGIVSYYHQLGDVQTLTYIVCALSSCTLEEASQASESKVLRFMRPASNSLDDSTPKATRHRAPQTIRLGTFPQLQTSIEKKVDQKVSCSQKSDWERKLERIAEKNALDELKSATSLLDTQTQKKLSQYCLVYADILYSWELFQKRCEILKFIAPNEVSPLESQQSTSFSVSVECKECKKIIQGPSCLTCKTFSSHCCICNISMTGFSVSCIICHHGGHPTHMEGWFKNQTVCPTGCGCKCIFLSGVS